MAARRNPDIAALDSRLLIEIERTAVEIARLASAEIVTAFGTMLTVKYKSDLSAAADAFVFRDPVSEVDQRVESLVRARIAERFPDHDVIGEEMADRLHAGGQADFVWAIDPIDGTSNFINGFPLFAASIGVVYRGVPVVGALWCSTTHALRSGVYHARVNARVCFDDVPLETRANPAVRRRLLGDPGVGIDPGLMLETRKTGSAAIECAFVAAGLLRVARFERPNIWDVAGGIALVQAAGLDVRAFEAGRWVPFDGFDPLGVASNADGGMRGWHRGLVLGEAVTVDDLCKAYGQVD